MRKNLKWREWKDRLLLSWCRHFHFQCRVFCLGQRIFHLVWHGDSYPFVVAFLSVYFRITLIALGKTKQTSKKKPHQLLLLSECYAVFHLQIRFLRWDNRIRFPECDRWPPESITLFPWGCFAGRRQEPSVTFKTFYHLCYSVPLK